MSDPESSSSNVGAPIPMHPWRRDRFKSSFVGLAHRGFLHLGEMYVDAVAVRLDPDDGTPRFLYTLSMNRLTEWDLRKRAIIHEQTMPEHVHALRLSPSGRWLAISGGYDEGVRLWGTAAARIAWEADNLEGRTPREVAFHADESGFVVVGEEFVDAYELPKAGEPRRLWSVDAAALGKTIAALPATAKAFQSPRADADPEEEDDDDEPILECGMITRDGRHLWIACEYASTLLKLDAASGELLYAQHIDTAGFDITADASCFDPARERFITTSDVSLALCWDLAHPFELPKKLCTEKTSSFEADAMAFPETANEGYLFDFDGTLARVDLEAWQLIEIEATPRFGDSSRSVVVAPDGSGLFVAESPRVKVQWQRPPAWLAEAEALERNAPRTGHASRITSLELAAGESRWLASAEADGGVILWALPEVEQHEMVHLTPHRFDREIRARKLAVTSAGCVIVATTTGHLVAHALEDGRELWRVSLGELVVSRLALDAAGERLLVVCGFDGLRIHACDTGERIYNFEQPVYDAVWLPRAEAPHQQALFLATATRTGEYAVYDPGSDTRLAHAWPPSRSARTNRVAVSPQGNRAAVLTQRHVHLYYVSTEALRPLGSLPARNPRDAAFSDDGRYLYLQKDTGSITAMDLESTGTQPERFTAHSRWTAAIQNDPSIIRMFPEPGWILLGSEAGDLLVRTTRHGDAAANEERENAKEMLQIMFEDEPDIPEAELLEILREEYPDKQVIPDKLVQAWLKDLRANQTPSS